MRDGEPDDSAEIRRQLAGGYLALRRGFYRLRLSGSTTIGMAFIAQLICNIADLDEDLSPTFWVAAMIWCSVEVFRIFAFRRAEATLRAAGVQNRYVRKLRELDLDRVLSGSIPPGE